ncbi:MAG: tetratricopeptide repeat protein [Verrucomicrobiaceae bacterium]|nr:tetratricopeptide repeat protein [Verrucomicrobiaceae bacterium]
MILSRVFLVVGIALAAAPASLRAQSQPFWVEKLARINAKLEPAEFAAPWKQLPDPERLLPDGIVGFEDAAGHAAVVVGGRDVIDAGSPDFVTEAEMEKRLEERRRELIQRVPNAEITASGMWRENDFPYIWLEYSVTPQGRTRKLHAITYSTVRDGYLLVIFAVGESAESAKGGAEMMLKSLKPLRSRGAPRAGSYPDYEAVALGFDTHLKAAGWQPWQDGATIFPASVISARRGAATFLVSEIVPLPEKGLPLGENFAAIMRATTRFENVEDALKVEKAAMSGFDEALKFSGTADTGEVRTFFSGWCGQGGGRMMMTMSWTPAKDAKALQTAREVLDAALGAVTPLPMTSAPAPSAFKQPQRDAQSNVLCEIAARLLRRGRNEDGAAAYDLALRWSHSQLSTLEAAVTGLQRAGDARRAEVLLTLYGDQFQDSPRLWLLRARLHAETGAEEKAGRDYAAAFRAGLRDEDAVAAFMSLLWNAQKNDEALKFIEAYEKAAPSPRIARWRAVTLLRLKDYDRALAIYATLVKARPLDVEAALQHGECANQAGRHDIALEAVALMLKENQDGPRTRLIEGWAHYGRKDWREAKLSFEAARKFTPNDPVVLDALNSANAALGEGDSSAVKTPIDALRLPDVVRARIDKAAAEFKPDEDESALNIFITTQIDFHAGKPTTTTESCKVKILDNAGVDAFSTIDIKFDPLSERVFMNQLEVLDEAGRVVARGRLEDQYVADPSMDGPATLGRVLRVPVPGLKPGRTLHYVHTKRTVEADKVPRFEDIWFGSTHPIGAQAVVLQGDLDKVRVTMNDAMKTGVQLIDDDASKTRTWLLAPAMQVHSEPFLPRIATFTPVLRLGAPDAEWTKVGADYLQLIAEQLKPEPEIEALARKITAGAKTDEQKIDLLSRHVRDEITYKAIEFGRRARIPNRASRVTANHYGDCKDMALLLHQLLRATGIASHLALINTRADMDAALPDLDQFNHMILHVPSLRAKFIDCTEGKSAGVNLPPSLFGLHAFVVDPANPRIEAMPARQDWPANRLDVAREVTFDSEGGADVSETVTFTDYLAQNMRMFLNSMPPQKRIDSMQAWQQRVSHWQIEKMEVEHLSDPASPLTLKLRYSIPPPALPGARTLEVPGTLECEYLEINHLRHRHHPYEVLHPVEVTSRVNVAAPAAIDAASLRSITRKDDTSPHCRWSMTATPASAGNAHECQIRFHAVLPAKAGPAAEYLPMRKAAAAAASAWHVPLRLGE